MHVRAIGILTCSGLFAVGCGEADSSDLAENAESEAALHRPPQSQSEHGQCTPYFTGVGVAISTADGVSADGSTLAGQLDWYRAYTYDGTIEMLPLPAGDVYSAGRGVSADGSVVAGSTGDTPQDVQATIWQDGTPMGLGFLSDATESSAEDISDDGKVVVGTSGGEAFRWDEKSGMVGRGTFTGARSFGMGVSRNGSVVVGYFNNADYSYHEAFMWRRGQGSTTLGVPSIYPWSRALGVSANGKVIVGDLATTLGLSPARWTKKEGWQLLGDGTGFAAAANRDGSVIVGRGSEFLNDAMVWDEEHGVRSIQSVLLDAGVMPAGWDLFYASDVSDSGHIVVGYGINPAGQLEAWSACLP